MPKYSKNSRDKLAIAHIDLQMKTINLYEYRVLYLRR